MLCSSPSGILYVVLFGQGKRGYHLNNAKARLPETSESWINAIFPVMNLTKLLMVAEEVRQNFFSIFISQKPGKLPNPETLCHLPSGIQICW